MMAEPIRKPTTAIPRRPPHGAPPHPLHPRPRAVPRIEADRADLAPPSPSRTAPEPPSAAFERNAPPPTVLPAAGGFAPAQEKRLRSGLQIALALHLVALLPFLLPAAGVALSLSDTLLATAVLVGGAAALTLGAPRRRER
jgi:hypothetical protein